MVLKAVPQRLFPTPLQCLAHFRGEREHGHLPPRDLGPLIPAGDKDGSQNRLAAPKAHSRQVTSWLLDHSSCWNVSTPSNKRPSQQTKATGEVSYAVINR